MMNISEQEEDVWRITAMYVAELNAGRQPRLHDYLKRYPRYASAIADFVAYYQAVELQQTDELPQTDDSLAYVPMTYESRMLMEGALLRASLPSEPLLSLFPAAPKHLTLTELAYALDLSEDIVTLLDQRLLTEESLPDLLIERLTFVLHRPEQAIRDYLKTPASLSFQRSSAHPELRYVAETPTSYSQNNLPAVPARSFLRALEESSNATPQQKRFWRGVVTDEIMPL
jgi:hypothetical protein